MDVKTKSVNTMVNVKVTVQARQNACVQQTARIR